MYTQKKPNINQLKTTTINKIKKKKTKQTDNVSYILVCAHYLLLFLWIELRQICLHPFISPMSDARAHHKDFTELSLTAHCWTDCALTVSPIESFLLYPGCNSLAHSQSHLLWPCLILLRRPFVFLVARRHCWLVFLCPAGLLNLFPWILRHFTCTYPVFVHTFISEENLFVVVVFSV